MQIWPEALGLVRLQAVFRWDFSVSAVRRMGMAQSHYTKASSECFHGFVDTVNNAIRLEEWARLVLKSAEQAAGEGAAECRGAGG